MSKRKLYIIRKKIETIGYGLLRFTEGSGQQSLHVSAVVENGTHVNCIVKDDFPQPSLLNRTVSLIQKAGDDYLYISGKVDDEVEKKGKIISLNITRACWFTRKKKGSAVWLQEKCIYQNPEHEIEKAS